MLEVAIRKRRRAMVVEAEFRLEAGAALALFGPSAAGKSTVLACIAGLDAPGQGAVRWQGVNWFPPQLPLHRRQLGYLTQSANLFPHLTVAENVAFGLPRRDTAWLDQLRQRLALEECWPARAQQISGGQARRVALARMLARKPPLVLLDEPFAGLDRSAVRELIAALLEWRRELGFTLIVVDHQADVVSQLAPRALVMDQGRVTLAGTWEELRRSASPTLAALLAPL